MKNIKVMDILSKPYLSNPKRNTVTTRTKIRIHSTYNYKVFTVVGRSYKEAWDTKDDNKTNVDFEVNTRAKVASTLRGKVLIKRVMYNPTLYSKKKDRRGNKVRYV